MTTEINAAMCKLFMIGFFAWLGVVGVAAYMIERRAR